MITTNTIKSKIANFNHFSIVRVLLVTITVMLTILYIWQVSVSSTRGYAVRDLQNQIDQLHRDDERLKMEVAKLQSVDSVTTRMQMLGLVKISDIHYLNSDTSVAMR